MIAVMLKFKLYLSINLWGWITIILDTYVRVFAANSDTSNSNSSSCSCWLEETTVSMCLRLSRLQIGSVLTMWYIKLFILSIKPGTLDDLLHICYTLFIIQLHRVSKFQVMIFFYLPAIWMTIKSHQSSQTRSTTWRIFMSCKYSS